MQLRQVDLRSVGHSNQKLSQKIDFQEFHHVNPLEHLKWVAPRYLWVYKFEKIHEAYFCPTEKHIRRSDLKSKKKNFEPG